MCARLGLFVSNKASNVSGHASAILSEQSFIGIIVGCGSIKGQSNVDIMYSVIAALNS